MPHTVMIPNEAADLPSQELGGCWSIHLGEGGKVGGLRCTFDTRNMRELDEELGH